jgi:hypothetical protein
MAKNEISGRAGCKPHPRTLSAAGWAARPQSRVLCTDVQCACTLPRQLCGLRAAPNVARIVWGAAQCAFGWAREVKPPLVAGRPPLQKQHASGTNLAADGAALTSRTAAPYTCGVDCDAHDHTGASFQVGLMPSQQPPLARTCAMQPDRFSPTQQHSRWTGSAHTCPCSG